MARQNMVHPYYGILLSYKKKWIINTCNNLDKSARNFAE